MEDALGLALDKVIHLVVEAALTHLELVEVPPRWLQLEVPLRHMLGCCDRRWEVVKVLEPMLVGLVHGECWPLRLQIEVDEARRARLRHSLMEGIHCACLVEENLVVMLRLLPAFHVTLLQGTEPFSHTLDVLLVLH